jgi:hypothetical protein
MIRHPYDYFVPERPKKLERFRIFDSNQAQEEVIEIESPEEETPLLSDPQKKHRKIKTFKKLVDKFLRKPKEQAIKIDMLELDIDYSWWTKFYNALKEEPYINPKLHRLKVFYIGSFPTVF